MYPILLALVLLNSCSFILFRMQRRRTCHLITWRKARSSRVMNYFIAGVLNQPQNAFRFLTKEVRGGLTFVQYDMLGWSAKDTAQQIAHDICKNRYNATIYTICVGDQVARYLEDILGNVKVVTINPCSWPELLKPLFYYGGKIIAPALMIICHLGLGWISALPLVRFKWGAYSLVLLADQLAEIAYGCATHCTTGTQAVVCSTEDKILQNDKIIESFQTSNIGFVSVKHGYTTEKPVLWLDAIRQLLKNP